jgi:hypothetical protein
VVNLYRRAHADVSIRAHYESYLRLLVASALMKYPLGRSALEAKLHSMQPDLLQVAFFPTVGS